MTKIREARDIGGAVQARAGAGLDRAGPVRRVARPPSQVIARIPARGPRRIVR